MVAIRQHGTLESEMFSHISLLHKKPSRHSVLFATVPPKPRVVLAHSRCSVIICLLVVTLSSMSLGKISS